MPPNPIDVLTLDEAKRALNIANTDRHDDELSGIITGMSARLDILIGPVVKRPKSERLTASRRSSSVYVTHWPVASVVGITEYQVMNAVTLTEELPGLAQPQDAFLLCPDEAEPSWYGGEIIRRSAGQDAYWASGRQAIAIDYVAGRFDSTEEVGEHYKIGARLMLVSYWRSQMTSAAKQDEYDVPYSTYPRYTVPKAVRDHFEGEIQDETLLVLS